MKIQNIYDTCTTKTLVDIYDRHIEKTIYNGNVANIKPYLFNKDIRKMWVDEEYLMIDID